MQIYLFFPFEANQCPPFYASAYVTYAFSRPCLYVLHDSAQSNGALSNGFNADSGVHWNNLTVIAFSVVARASAG